MTGKKNLEDLLIEELGDIFSGEEQIMKASPIKESVQEDIGYSDKLNEPGSKFTPDEPIKK